MPEWQCTLRGATLREGELNAGEWEQLYLLVNRAGLSHAESEIRPAHCPTCRNCIAVTTMVLRGPAGMGMAAAAMYVAMLDRGDLVDAFLEVDSDAELAVAPV